MGCYGSSALAAAAVDGVVGAGPAVAVWWLLGYSRRGISPTLGDLACAAVRGCVLGYSQWGISLPLAAPGLGNRQHDLGNALRTARRAATASATSPLLRSCGMPAVCVFGGGVHVPFVRSVLAANAPRATHPPAPARVPPSSPLHLYAPGPSCCNPGPWWHSRGWGAGEWAKS